METKHWVLEGINEWKQFKGGWNWYTMTLIHIEIENDKMTYGYELNFVLLGLGFWLRYNTDKANEQFDEWKRDDDYDDPMTFEEFKELNK